MECKNYLWHKVKYCQFEKMPYSNFLEEILNVEPMSPTPGNTYRASLQKSLSPIGIRI